MKVKKFLLAIVIVAALIAALAACKTVPKDKGFVVSPSDPNFPAGEIETQIDRTFPLRGLKKINVTVTYYPYDDAVCLRYRSDFYEYHQFWSKAGREVFLKDFEQYQEEYDARSLNMRNKKSKKAYGGTEGYLTWQTFKLTRRFEAKMDMELGYAFQDNSPYFAVTQKLTTYENPTDVDDTTSSQEITMYFTRAQAQELAALFDPELLRTLTTVRPRSTVETDVATDAY